MPNPIHIYTDGACHPPSKTGAWAVIILMDNQQKTLQAIVTHTTHNRMELTAAIKAIEYIHTQTTSPHPITIYSDSQYVVDLTERKEKLKRHHFTTRKGSPIQNADLVQQLIHHLDTAPVTLIKVPAHQKKDKTINHNREVDKLVRKVLRNHIQGMS